MDPVTDALLAQLRDVHAPASAGWWPPAPGWWISALLSVVLALAIARRLVRRRAPVADRNWLLAARHQLLALKSDQASSVDDDRARIEVVAEALAIARRAALAIYPRDQIAALHGTAWLEYLQRHSRMRLPALAPWLQGRLYQPSATASASEVDAVVDEVTLLLEAIAARSVAQSVAAGSAARVTGARRR